MWRLILVKLLNFIKKERILWTLRPRDQMTSWWGKSVLLRELTASINP